MSLIQHISALESLGLIQPVADPILTLEYRFRHALVHDAAYSTMLRQDRRNLHQAVGELLEREPVEIGGDLDPVLGRHFFEAGDLERASRYFGRAAESAARKYAHAEALAYYSQAIQAALTAVEKNSGNPDALAADMRLADLYHDRAQVHARQGAFDEARADYEQAAEAARAAGSPADEWQALLGLALLWAQRDYDRTGEYSQQALALAQQMGEPTLLARSYNRLGNWRLNVLQPREAADYHEQALEIFESLQDDTGMAETLDLLGMTNMLGSRLVRAANFYQQAIELNQRRGDKLALATVLISQLLSGSSAFQTLTLTPSPVAARDLLAQGEQALQLVRESGFRPGEAYTNFILAYYTACHGQYSRSLAAARDGLEIAASIGHKQWLAANHYVHGLIYLDLLAVAPAIEQLETGLSYSRQIASRHWITTQTGMLAQALLEYGQVDEAARMLDSAGSMRRPPQAIGERVVIFASALLAHVRGQDDAALAVVEELLESAEAAAPGQPSATPRMLLLRGAIYAGLGRVDEAGSDFQTGLSVAAAFGEGPSLWRLHAALAQLLEAQAQPAAAEDQRTQGLKVVAELAKDVPESQLRETFVREAARRLSGSTMPLGPRL
jgi:tetratricopeptide (TPR) repeat protein